jgi:hypothetical protein
VSYHEWIDVALGLGSIASLIVSVLVGYRLSRRGAVEDKVAELDGRQARVEGFLEARLGYRGD